MRRLTFFRDRGKFEKIFNPIPSRVMALRLFDKMFNILDYEAKLKYSTILRPEYGHCMRHAALLARKLGHNRISVIEFGVAGGNGLVSLEEHAEHVRKDTGVEVAIYGFDTGSGMPAALDYRDIPYMFQRGYYTMNASKLKARLKSAKLIFGPIEETLRGFFAQENPPPVGFIAFDLDYYSSTKTALRVFDAEHKYLLPRVACYVDDIVGDIDWALNEFTGELLAISEFNAGHERVKIAPVRGLRFSFNRIPQSWHEKIFVAHLFAHEEYCRPTNEQTQLPLDG